MQYVCIGVILEAEPCHWRAQDLGVGVNNGGRHDTYSF